MTIGYRYNGLKTWTRTDNRATAEAFYNPHRRVYECRLTGDSPTTDGIYTFCPDLVGHADGFVVLTVSTPRHDTVELSYDPYYRVWVEYVLGEGTRTHHSAVLYEVPAALDDLMCAALSRCVGYQELAAREGWLC